MPQKDPALKHQCKFNSQLPQPQFQEPRHKCAHQEDAIIDKCHLHQDDKEIKYYPSIEQAQERLCSQVSRTQFQSTPIGKNPESAVEKRLYTLHHNEFMAKQFMHSIQNKSTLPVLIPMHSPAELREFKHHCIPELMSQTQPNLLFNHDLREKEHITNSALHFQNLLWRQSVSITNNNITECFYWIRRHALQGRPDQAYLEPAYQVVHYYRQNE